MNDRKYSHIKPNEHFNLVVVLGPTAGGKTLLASHLAYHLDSAVISADSRQVYKGMSIGTGKDLEDYMVHGTQIPYHLIDIIDAGYKYNIFEYQRDFFPVFDNIISQHKMPVMCGGSGLYIESVLKKHKLIRVPVNEELRSVLTEKSDQELAQMLASMKKLHNHTDTDTRKRTIRAIEIETYYLSHPEEQDSYPEINPLIIGVVYDRDEQRERITQRLHQRLKSGMIEEVQQLLQQGVSAEELLYYGLEYKFITQYLMKEISYDEMVTKLNIAIHQFGKRQMTWFRKMEKDGFKINWLKGALSFENKLNDSLRMITDFAVPQQSTWK